MKYRLVQQCADQHPVRDVCDFLGVSRSGYYKWLDGKPGKRAYEDAKLERILEAEFENNRKAYGARRLRERLRRLGRKHGRRRIRRLMEKKGLNARKKRRFVLTTVADPAKRPASNELNRNFAASGPNQKWASDITQIPTSEGDLYLAVTMDLWSRMIVGWSIRETMEEKLVHEAFDMAVLRRAPNAGFLHHSDRGSQYTSNGFRSKLRDNEVIESNSRKGNVWDNAVLESFFSSLEVELLQKMRFETKAKAIQEVFIYIEVFYNRKRAHSTLGNRSPTEFEADGGN